MPDWLTRHVRAFEFFGGMPKVLVPDNLKSGVNKSCRYDPELNPSYQHWPLSRLLNWAQSIGPDVLVWVKTQLQRKPHPEQAYRVCLGLLNLSRSYPAERLNHVRAR